MHTLLREARKRANLTVAQAAHALGVTRACIYAWETAPGPKGLSRLPDADRLLAIANLYGMNDDERASMAVERAFGGDVAEAVGA